MIEKKVSPGIQKKTDCNFNIDLFVDSMPIPVPQHPQSVGNLPRYIGRDCDYLIKISNQPERSQFLVMIL